MDVLSTVNLLTSHCVQDQQLSKLSESAILDLHSQLRTKWHVVNGASLRQEFLFDDFIETMVFVNDVAALAEGEGHHPDMAVSHTTVVLELTTHALDGLSENDFILARKIEMCC